jgi:hypothetical protein
VRRARLAALARGKRAPCSGPEVGSLAAAAVDLDAPAAAELRHDGPGSRGRDLWTPPANPCARGTLKEARNGDAQLDGDLDQALDRQVLASGFDRLAVFQRDPENRFREAFLRHRARDADFRDTAADVLEDALRVFPRHAVERRGCEPT